MNLPPKQIGAIYKIIADPITISYYPFFELGDLVKMIHDDGTDSPKFRLLNNQKILYIYMGKLELISPFYWLKIRVPITIDNR